MVVREKEAPKKSSDTWLNTTLWYYSNVQISHDIRLSWFKNHHTERWSQLPTENYQEQWRTSHPLILESITIIKT